MSAFQVWGDMLTTSFINLWDKVIVFIPNVVLAVVIFLAGWVVGSLLGNVVARVIRALKIDNILREAGIGTICDRAGWKLDAGKFVGILVELFVVVAFLMAALDVLHLNTVNEFIGTTVAGYLPKLIVAVLMLLVAGIVADVMEKVVNGAARAANVGSANFLGKLTRWAIWAFALMAALIQVDIFSFVPQVFITGVVAAASIALGLAFGLGGQDAAAQVIDRVRREISSHQQ